MSKKAIKRAEETVVEIEETQETRTNFLEMNQKTILYGVGILAVLIGGWFFYKYYIVGSKQQEALQQMAQAEYAFERDSFQMALDNPGGGNKGFLALSKDYSGTDAGKAAAYYAGICYLNLGQFDQAITYLEKSKPGGKILPMMRYAALGDAYSEKKNMDKAADYYRKAANQGGSDLLASLSLFKLGLLYQMQNKNKEALAAYKEIKEKFPLTPNGRDIEKYIVALE